MADSLFAIARSGLEVERQRVEVIARNLAHAGTALAPDGQGYRPRTLLSGPGGSFAAALGGAPTQTTAADRGRLGVSVLGLAELDTPPRWVHDPAHPRADAQGRVAYPGVDHAGQMTLLVQTQRAYEANLVMFNAARSMSTRALELGRPK
jgi:flagellar basal-body rod protein FlgC